LNDASATYVENPLKVPWIRPQPSQIVTLLTTHRLQDLDKRPKVPLRLAFRAQTGKPPRGWTVVAPASQTGCRLSMALMKTAFIEIDFATRYSSLPNG